MFGNPFMHSKLPETIGASICLSIILLVTLLWTMIVFVFYITLFSMIYGSGAVSSQQERGSSITHVGCVYVRLSVANSIFLSFKGKLKLKHLPSVYSLNDSLTDSLICPHNAFVSYLKLVPGSRACSSNLHYSLTEAV